VELFDEFPSLGRAGLRDMKKGIDFAFRDFSRANGEAIESFFDPLMFFMVWFENLLIEAPWPLMILIFASLAWLGARSIPIAIGTIVSFFAIGWFGMWEDTMATVAIISVATFFVYRSRYPLGYFDVTVQSVASGDYACAGCHADDSQFRLFNTGGHATGYW